ncbi:MAG: AraC family transcriptional regulator [Bacteroidetes bacterium]|nr:MAG: AraC family transcriptional regulator [Bacteroidota bacterium]
MISMELSKILEIIISAGAVQGFFLAMLLMTGKNSNKRSGRILSILFIILSLSIAQYILIPKNLGLPYRIKEPFILLIGPFLLFYIQEITEGKRFTFLDLIHFLPFVIFFWILIPIFVHGNNNEYSELLYKHSLVMSDVIWAIIVVQYGYYWWRIVKIIKIHRKNVVSEFSNIDGKTLSWMRSLLFIFGIFFFILAFTIIIVVHLKNYLAVDTIVCCSLSIIIFILGYRSILQKDIYVNKEEVLKDKTEQKNNIELNESELEMIEKIIKYIEKEKPYLDSGLTLTSLAHKLNLTRNKLSYLINIKLAENFYEFINKYRVEEVKRLLSQPNNQQFTIIALAFEAGFSSKSSFQTNFKKFTGLTPTEYLKRLL